MTMSGRVLAWFIEAGVVVKRGESSLDRREELERPARAGRMLR
jgi:hypothetical protein